MKILNLARIKFTEKEHKDLIEYSIIKFPDGQQSLRIEETLEGVESVQIQSRLNSFLDLELILCANQSLKELGISKVELYVPYFLGARSDRKFESGSANYLKTVICPIINSQNFEKVIVLDPHSDVIEACLDRVKIMSNVEHVEIGFDHFGLNSENTVLVSPDAGALKKIYSVAKALNLPDQNVLTATKHREISTGKILSTHVPLGLNCIGKDFLIVDDICDGGRTFVELAKVIKEAFPLAKVYLVVTHGIFSAGLDSLSEYFNGIFTTDSIKNIRELEQLNRNQILMSSVIFGWSHWTV